MDEIVTAERLAVAPQVPYHLGSCAFGVLDRPVAAAPYALGIEGVAVVRSG
jgi:hypothetical protein